MKVMHEPNWKALWNAQPQIHPDWWVWTGVWYEMEGDKNYYTHWPMLTPESVVLDIGCYEGEWSRRIAQAYHCTIHGFEPATRAYKVAKERLKVHPNVHLHNIGLWNMRGKQLLYNAQRDGSSIFDEKYAGAVSEQVRFADVKAVWRWLKLGHIDLMSINIEGAEFVVLSRLLELGLVPTIERFMIQWHCVFDGSVLRQFEIQSRLAQTHKMIWNLGAWEAWELKRLETNWTNPGLSGIAMTAHTITM